MKVRTIFCVVAVSVGLASAASATLAASEFLLFVGERVSLRVSEEPLRDVLSALSAEGEFILVEKGEPDANLTLSLELEGADWGKVFQRLIGDWAYVVEWDNTGRPVRVIVNWNQSNDSAAIEAGALSDTEIEAQIRAAAQQITSPSDPVADVIDDMYAAKAALEEARFALQSADESSRAAAQIALEEAEGNYQSSLRSMGSYDDSRVVEALVPTLEEGDRESQIAAMESLRWVSKTHGSPTALSHALSMTRDLDPEVSRAALEVAVRYEREAVVLPILKEIALASGPNQSFAAREWLRIKAEIEARQKEAETGGQQLRE